jgi:hypothetical protein
MTIEYDISGQADLIHTLATGGSRECQSEIVRFLLSNNGADLTRLKNRINATDDHRDFDFVLHEVIEDDVAREQVLAHVKEEAAKVRGPEVKVLSDVDDTAFASLNDGRFPKGTQYPGVVAFWAALDRGPTDRPFSLGDLVLVTARPGSSLGIVERRLINKMHAAGVGDLSVLTGSLTHLFTHSRMAHKKLENIERFHEEFGEYHLVFVGDSGQGDVLVGRELRKRLGDVVLGVFIHNVNYTQQAERRQAADEGIWFFDTYVGAALKAFQQNLISEAGLRNVIQVTLTEQQQIEWQDPVLQRAADAELMADVSAARDVLGSQLGVSHPE